MITLFITINYKRKIFQKFIEKPREFIDIYGKYHYFHSHRHACIHEHGFFPQNDSRPYPMRARGRRLPLFFAARTIPKSVVSESTAIAGKCGVKAD